MAEDTTATTEVPVDLPAQDDLPDGFQMVTGPAEAAQLAEAAATSFPSSPPRLAPNVVKLPGGLHLDGKLINTAEVRELNGKDEEALSQSLMSNDMFHFMTTLLERGTVRLGDEPPERTPELLPRMLIGDRDSLVLGIRDMTYGPEVEVRGWACRNCGVRQDKLSVDIFEDIKFRELEPDGLNFEVRLKRGGTAYMHLVTGEIQAELNKAANRNAGERTTLLLQRTVDRIVDHNGNERSLIAWPSTVQELSMQDRRTLVSELNERQPGPQLNDIEYVDVSCGQPVTMGVDLTDLFLQ